MSRTIMLTDNSLFGPSLDITQPEHGVEVRIRSDGKVLWVNVDGVCRLRVCMIDRLDIEDERDVQG